MRWKRTPLRFEILENRDLPSGVVQLDSAWLQSAGSGPFVLDQPDTIGQVIGIATSLLSHG